MFSNGQVLTAEIWILNIALLKSSEVSCDGLGKLFMAMFLESNIAKKFQVSRIKCSYVTKFGITPYFLELLFKEISVLLFMWYPLMSHWIGFCRKVRWIFWWDFGIKNWTRLMWDIQIPSYWVEQMQNSY